MEQQDMIEKYLHGQMTSEEEAAFKEQIKNDKELREEVRMHALLVKQMRAQKEEEKQKILADVAAVGSHVAASITADSAAEPAVATVASSRSRIFAMWSSIAVAAMVVLFFGTKMVYLNTQSNRLVDKYFTAWTPDASSLSRGASGTDERQVVLTLDTLFNNVNKDANLKQTIAKLQTSLKAAETNEIYYYYYEDINWYLALAYVKNQQYDEAKPLLRLLMQQSDLYAPKAKQLYEEIEKLHFV